MQRAGLPVLVMFAAAAVWAQTAEHSAVQVVTGDARVDQLLSRMTLEEKITLFTARMKMPGRTRGKRAIWRAFRGWGSPACDLPTGRRVC